MKNNEFQKVRIKNSTCSYFDDITKVEDFNLNNVTRNVKMKYHMKEF